MFSREVLVLKICRFVWIFIWVLVFFRQIREITKKKGFIGHVSEYYDFPDESKSAQFALVDIFSLWYQNL